MRKGPVMILLPCPWCGPREATEFARLVEAFTKALEAADVETRLAAIEQRMGTVR